MMKSIEIHRNPLKLMAVSFLISICFYLFPGVAEAATYYVATNGSDANSCVSAQNVGSPKRNIMGENGGMACLKVPGDKLYVRGGNYAEKVSNVSSYQIFPSGTSWANAFMAAVYPGESVTIQGIGFGDCCQNPPMSQMSYWIFDGFRVVDTGNGGIYNGLHTDHLRFINMEVTNNATSEFGSGTGNCVAGTGAFFEFINVHIHNCGAYGVYYTGHDTLFDRIKMHDVYGYGFHLYHQGARDVYNITVRNSELYDIHPGTPAGTYPGTGILLSSGYGSRAYNNIVRNSGAGIDAAYGSNGFMIYNNTIYNNIGNGISVSYLDIGGVSIKNNIAYNNGGSAFVDWTNVNPIYSNNICGTSGSGCTLVADPKFVNPSSNDFHLQSSSPAINYGVVLSEFTTDKDGNTRMGNYDAGAYEYGGTVTQPLLGDINNDRIVNSLDWSLMSAKWLTSDTSADLNKDGAVNSLDWSIMSSNWLKTG